MTSLLYFIGCLVWLFLLSVLLRSGLNISFDYEDKWWGGFPFWMIWSMGWVFGPPIILLVCLGVL